MVISISQQIYTWILKGYSLDVYIILNYSYSLFLLNFHIYEL